MAISVRAEKFLQRLKNGELLVCDGAWSSEMQKLGLQAGDCPEEWNVTQPARVRQIAAEYCKAGAELILTNTFGGTRYRLMRHGFAGKVREFNRAGAAIAREAAEEYGAFVAASAGPTGEFIEPEGMVKEREMHDAFAEQMSALKEGGADGVCIETMYVLDEALAAVRAARSLGLFCIASMTYESSPEGFRTMLGTGVDEATRALDAAGADVIGTNCGNAMPEMIRLAARMRLFTKKPLLVKANAGLPELTAGKASCCDAPGAMAAQIAGLKAAGVQLIGGCCGTTPEYIRQFRAETDRLRQGQ